MNVFGRYLHHTAHLCRMNVLNRECRRKHACNQASSNIRHTMTPGANPQCRSQAVHAIHSGLLRFSLVLAGTVGAIVFLGCSNPAFKQLSSSILTSSGMMTQSQADSLLTAGEQVAKSQETLTPEQEYYLGRAVSARVLSRFRLVTNPGMIHYVNQVGQAVASVSATPETFGGYHFAVVDSPEINAMSAPGGFIFISRGFLKLLPNEDALAAVFAHEVAHVVQRHGVRAIANSSLLAALSTVTKEGVSTAAASSGSTVDIAQLTDLFSDSVSGVADKLLSSGYGRSQEYDADKYAQQLLQNSGYDQASLAVVLRILEHAPGDPSNGWYATHPSPKDRISERSAASTEQVETSSAMKTRTSRFVQAMRAL